MSTSFVSAPQVFLLPLKTVSEMNSRGHWGKRAARARKERKTACAETKARHASLPCVVTLTRIGHNELDDDNLGSALKAVRDGVADSFEIDDRDKRVEWRYAQEKCGRGKFAVQVMIESKAA